MTDRFSEELGRRRQHSGRSPRMRGEGTMSGRRLMRREGVMSGRRPILGRWRD